MEVDASYTDSHGHVVEIGFGITRLLGFDLLPRIKRINKTRLYSPVIGEPGAWPRLEPVLTRPIRWDLIASQYDQMIKYAYIATVTLSSNTRTPDPADHIKTTSSTARDPHLVDILNGWRHTGGA